MRTFTRVAVATVLAGGLAVSGTGAAFADPRDEGILGHVLSDLLGPHVPDAESLQEDPSPAEEAPADTGVQEAPTSTTTPGETMTPGEGTGGTLP
ncbi:hypothetical protein HNR06_000606 [Nocardiopsis arvandica]|uniref:Uncharacterized protein n=1 Tax=Nocardiopsis sinuspersici TaxID=501010 RepID=A0A7Z0BJ37_9ACTN|nr:hypothetical protein [Nocardiopsis sinuspersici]NYH51017.1 hypothetical protein [Nocardiopsis sinuspersici]